MASNQGLAAAFTIFAKYGDDNVAAEHDEIFAGPNPDKVSKEDMETLQELGWRVNKEFGCFHKFT